MAVLQSTPTTELSFPAPELRTPKIDYTPVIDGISGVLAVNNIDKWAAAVSLLQQKGKSAIPAALVLLDSCEITAPRKGSLNALFQVLQNTKMHPYFRAAAAVFLNKFYKSEEGGKIFELSADTLIKHMTDKDPFSPALCSITFDGVASPTLLKAYAGNHHDTKVAGIEEAAAFGLCSVRVVVRKDPELTKKTDDEIGNAIGKLRCASEQAKLALKTFKTFPHIAPRGVNLFCTRLGDAKGVQDPFNRIADTGFRATLCDLIERYGPLGLAATMKCLHLERVKARAGSVVEVSAQMGAALADGPNIFTRALHAGILASEGTAPALLTTFRETRDRGTALVAAFALSGLSHVHGCPVSRVMKEFLNEAEAPQARLAAFIMGHHNSIEVFRKELGAGPHDAPQMRLIDAAHQGYFGLGIHTFLEGKNNPLEIPAPVVRSD